MPVNKKNSRSVLGDNPLSQSIFTKTEMVSSSNFTDVNAENDEELETRNENLDSRKNNLESGNESQVSIINNLETKNKDRDSGVENLEFLNESQESRIDNLDSRSKNQESRINNLELGDGERETESGNRESRFLQKGKREAINLRVPIELNDWMNDLLRNGKRRHGSKIPKEIWLQAALELFRAMPVDWESIEDEDGLREVLENLESRI